MTGSLRRGRRIAALAACVGVALVAGGAAAAPKPATFGDAQPYPRDGVGAAAVVDLNGDGKPDVAGATSNAVVLMFNGGDGTLGAPVSVSLKSSAGDSPQAGNMTAADLDGDGRTDLAVTEFGDHVIAVLHNK